MVSRKRRVRHKASVISQEPRCREMPQHIYYYTHSLTLSPPVANKDNSRAAFLTKKRKTSNDRVVAVSVRPIDSNAQTSQVLLP